MKTQILSAFGLLAATGAAAPGGCHDYSYDIPSCDHCPSPSHEWFGNSCHRECPKQYRQCKEDYGKDHSYSSSNSFSFELQYSEEISCPKDYSYDLQVKVESCSSGEYSGQECLNVYYGDSSYGKRSSISQCNLGIYLEQQSYYKPEELNYNNYCHDDRCEVPTEKLPSYPDLCEKEIYLAVGNNVCYDDYNYEDYSQATKYVKVKVSCSSSSSHEYEKPEEHCQEECCCYHP